MRFLRLVLTTGVLAYLLVATWARVSWQEFALLFYLFVTVRALRWDYQQLRQDTLSALMQMRELLTESLDAWKTRLKRSA